MKKDLKQVKEFHEVFGQPVLDKPQIPGEDRCNLRVSLLQEELNELKEAILNKDLVEVADALADLQYVLNGAVLEFGLQDKFEALCDEVHRSNMSKTCKDIQEIVDTISHYMDKGVLCYGDDRTGIVRRTEDDKILKSVNYSPANLKTIVQES